MSFIYLPNSFYYQPMIYFILIKSSTNSYARLIVLLSHVPYKRSDALYIPIPHYNPLFIAFLWNDLHIPITGSEAPKSSRGWRYHNSTGTSYSLLPTPIQTDRGHGQVSEIWNQKSELWNLESEIWYLESKIWNLNVICFESKSKIWNLKSNI